MENCIYDVFISYSRKDSETADKITRAFEQAGITYFIDRQGIGGGLEFPAVLAKAIRDSKIFLFLASENSYTSKFTQSEIVYAFNKKQKQCIIPYIIDGSTMPDELEFTFSAINWRRMDEHPIETVLVDDILRKIGKTRPTVEPVPSSPSVIETPPPPKKKRKTKRNYFANVFLAFSIFVFLFLLILGFTNSNFITNHFELFTTIWFLTLLSSFVLSILGMIRPKWLKLEKRKEVVRYYIVSLLICIIATFALNTHDPKNQTSQEDEAVASEYYEIGTNYFDKGEYTEAVKWLTKAAESGNIEAQFKLGNMYYNGEGIEQDYKEAFKWFKKAAEGNDPAENDPAIQYNLGIMYGNGLGVAQDYKEAEKWFRYAANQGYAPAQSQLGKMYFNGYGVTKDITEAEKWIRKAAEQGYPEAQSNLGIFYYLGWGVESDNVEAVKWLTKAAEQGNVEAQLNLGVIFESGDDGVDKDLSEALKWYSMAADQGNEAAMEKVKELQNK